jgi:exosortase A
MSAESKQVVSVQSLHTFSGVVLELINVMKAQRPLIIALLFQALLFNTAWKAFYRTWTSQDFSYGMAIIPISLYLVWRMRASLEGLQPKRHYFSLCGVAVGASIWLAGHITATASVMQLGVVVAGVFTVLCFLGLKIGRVIWFPLFFVFMMVPFGGWLTPYLTDWTADAVHIGLQIIGIPVYREGEEFILPTGRWSVISACSGLRFFLSAIVLSILFAHLNFRKFRTSFLFVVAAIIASILANWIRAIITVLTGHLTHMKFGPGEEHLWFGWVTFGLAMWVTFWCASRWSDTDAMPEQRHIHAPSIAKPNPLSSKVLASVFIIVGIFGFSARQLVSPASSALVSTFSAQSILASTQVEKIAYEPSFVGTSAILRGTISNGQSQFLVALFAGQANSVSMLSLLNQVTPDDEKEEWKMRAIQTRALSDLGFSVKEFVAMSQKGNYRVQYWYTVGGVHTVSAVKAKLLTLKNVLLGFGDTSILNLIVHKGAGVNAANDAEEIALLKSVATNSSVLTLKTR